MKRKRKKNNKKKILILIIVIILILSLVYILLPKNYGYKKETIEVFKENNLYEEYKTELEYTYARLLLCSSLFRITKIEDAKIRKQLLNETWTRLNNEFPNWKKNEILKKDKSAKNFYMKTVNKFTYKIYCAIFSA